MGKMKRITIKDEVGYMTNDSEVKIKNNPRGIKIAIGGSSKMNDLIVEARGAVCSECFHWVALSHRHCWFCGVVLSSNAHEGTYEQIQDYRKSYQEQENSDWKNDEED